MKETRIMMDMPITVEILDNDDRELMDVVFDYFTYIDSTFSTYKSESEISKYNRGEIGENLLSRDVQIILSLAEQTKRQTNGYFDIKKDSLVDPSGIVKGWAIYQAALILKEKAVHNFYLDVGGDIQVLGKNKNWENWKIGIRNPFNRFENVKILSITDKGVATSGTYIRGNHIYNPFHLDKIISDIVSLTVVGPDIYEADRFATAAFAMGKEGINFIESLPDLEGYMIDKDGKATYTSDFERYVV